MTDEASPALLATRRALHGVAELVLAGPQYDRSGTIRLRVTPGGFGTVSEPELRFRHGQVVGPGGEVAVDGRTAAQVAAAVGVEPRPLHDLYSGGPGIPVLGWSTVAGDLRIPHFVGMHTLQALILFVIALEWAAARVGVLADVRVRSGLVGVATALATATTAIVTVQALAGESIVAPSAATATATSLAWGTAVVAGAVVISSGARRLRDRSETTARSR